MANEKKELTSEDSHLEDFLEYLDCLDYSYEEGFKSGVKFCGEKYSVEMKKIVEKSKEESKKKAIKNFYKLSKLKSNSN